MTLEIANFGRNQLAHLLRDLDFKVGVEVGVADGVYSRILMEANPQMKLYGVDQYAPYQGYRDYISEYKFADMLKNAQKRLSKYSNYEFIRSLSSEAVKRFEDNSLDFVYLDGNHADPVLTEDITNWYKKLRPGGILAGHDYIRPKGSRGRILQQDVKDAIKKFTHENHLILFILGTSAVRPGEVRDKSRSWMVIK